MSDNPVLTPALRDAVIAWADTHIDLLPQEAPGRLGNHFWINLVKQGEIGRAVGIVDGRRPWRGVDYAARLRDLFATAADTAAREAFSLAQKDAIDSFNAALAGMQTPLEPRLGDLAEQFEVIGGDGMRVIRHVQRHEAIFRDVAALRIMQDFVAVSMDVVRRCNDDNRNSLGFTLAAHLHDAYGWEMLPGRAVQIFYALTSPQQKEETRLKLAANRQPPRIRLTDIDPDEVRGDDGLREVYKAEKARQGRSQMRAVAMGYRRASLR